MPSSPFILELEGARFEDAVRALAGSQGFISIDARRAGPSQARRSLVAADPLGTFSMAGGFVTTDGHTTIDNPHEALGRFCSRVAGWRADPYLPFSCGIIGYIGFEAARALRGLSPADGFSRHPQCRMGLYGAVATFDHREGTALVVANGDDTSEARRRAYILRDRILAAAGNASNAGGSTALGPVRMTPDEARFRRTFELARSWIRSDLIDRFHLVRHAEAPFAGRSPIDEFLAASSDGVRTFVGYEGSGYLFTSTDAIMEVDGDAVRSSFRIAGSGRGTGDEIAGSLSALCEEGSFSASKDQDELRMRGTLGRWLDPIDMVIGMTPSHFATGAPYGRALDFIEKNENVHRSFYGGTFGTIDPIRCSFRTIDRAAVFTDGTVGMTAGIDLDESSDADNVSRRLIECLSGI